MDAFAKDDLIAFYQDCWKSMIADEVDGHSLEYSNPVEDRLVYSEYIDLLSEHGLARRGGTVLDVGAGSGRWFRFLHKKFKPLRIVALDATDSSLELLRKLHGEFANASFAKADISSPGLRIEGGPFDLINCGNVLFHLMQEEAILTALKNMREALSDTGAIVTTEYLPKTTVRTRMMLVLGRDKFYEMVNDAGLKVLSVKAFSFFANDPMGLDTAAEKETEAEFYKVRAGMIEMLRMDMDAESKNNIVDFFASVEKALLLFGRARFEEADFPSQKLVLLARK